MSDIHEVVEEAIDTIDMLGYNIEDLEIALDQLTQAWESAGSHASKLGLVQQSSADLKRLEDSLGKLYNVLTDD